MAKHVTMQDIAEASGVSRQAVGFALGNNLKMVSKETSQRVFETAQKLGYKRFSSAVSLRTGKTNCVALILSKTSSSYSMMSGIMMSALTEQLHAYGYHLIVDSITDEKLTDGNFIPKILREVMSDGLLINYNANIPQSMKNLIKNSRLPAVWLNSKHKTNSVYPNDFEAAYSATKKFLSLQHKRIAYLDFTHSLNDPPWHYSGTERFEGYKKAMLEANFAPVRYGSLEEFDEQRGIVSTVNLLSSSDRPTAILAYRQREAALTVTAAEILKLKIPEDLSIINFYSRIEPILGPNVATMIRPDEKLVRIASEKLIHLLADDTQKNFPSIPVPFDFKSGDSLAKCSSFV